MEVTFLILIKLMNIGGSKMDNLPIIKNFEIDYSFIIKNYLNPELWHKKWNLFIYKNFVFCKSFVTE